MLTMAKYTNDEPPTYLGPSDQKEAHAQVHALKSVLGRFPHALRSRGCKVQNGPVSGYARPNVRRGHPKLHGLPAAHSSRK